MPDDLRDLIVNLPDGGDGLLPVCHATARCSWCDWRASMTGDSDEELAEFLRLLLTQHVTEMHRRP